MAGKRRKSSGKKRTITPEHLAKMQEGRKHAAVRRNRISELEELGLNKTVPMTYTERILSQAKRKK